MFQGSRTRLLAYYLIVMAAILCLFSTALYLLYSRSLHSQLDTNLQTVARVAAPSLIEIERKGEQYFPEMDEPPWRAIFNPEQQSLEWFDADGKLLASQGNLNLFFAPNIGFWTLKTKKAENSPNIQTFTLLVSIDRSSLNQPLLRGYIRSSQSTEILQADQQQFLWQLGISTLMILGVVAGGGIWLAKKALEPIERSFQQLKQFTADASHELRSPLTAIKTSVDVMRNHPERFQDKDLKKLAAIASATGQMTHLTQDLLFLARTEGAGKNAEREAQTIALHHLLEDIIDLLEPIAQDKQIMLEYRCLAKLIVFGDPAQLSRLFTSLLENALQYTPSKGKVLLRLVQQNHLAVVSVEDTGMGIAPENLSLVFERFWRADQARVYRQGGTGLGLAIAQAIAKHHDGQIMVSSEVDVGSCFQVSLPIYKSDLRQALKSWSLRLIFLSIRDFIQNKSLSFFKKLVFLLAIFILSILPIFVVKAVVVQIYTFHGVYFPNGAASFADEVVDYQPFDPLSQAHLANILGIPNSSTTFAFLGNNSHHVALVKDGYIILKFTDNLLTGSGDQAKDLWIFTVGQSKASLLVEISQDGEIWHRLDWIYPPQNGIDLDQFGWGIKDYFSYVRLTNQLPDDKKAVNIDAVGAISSALLVSSATSFLPLGSPFAKILLLIGLTFAIGYGVSYWFKKKN